MTTRTNKDEKTTGIIILDSDVVGCYTIRHTLACNELA
jgi:hypothetical protein